jgi:hypothetical protein
LRETIFAPSSDKKIKIKMKKFFLALFASALLISCNKEDENLKNGIYKGKEVAIHHGKGWTWLQLDRNGKPERLAITLNEEVLNSVPVEDANANHAGGHTHGNNIILPLHAKASITPFKHVGLDWNPSGHEPAGVYTRPHFDFHFYMISETERLTIPIYETDSLKFKNYPAPAYFPPTYVPIPGGVPQMGAHWVDFTSPELDPVHPSIFTQTFIYGSYNGNVTFYEPMITLDFLKNTTVYERSIPQPAKFQQAGYYPTKLRVIKHNGLTEIILDGFVLRQQS